MKSDVENLNVARRAARAFAATAALVVLAACGGGDDQTATGGEPPDDMTTEPSDDMTEPSDDMTEPSDDMTEPSDDMTEPEVAAGVYRAYDADALAEPGYDRNVIFFHAPWCPECRAFEEAIESGTIPDGIQILKLDYDTSGELKQRYGVTIQSTFVEVDADGEKVADWVGYGKERSIEAILRELG